MTIITLTQAIPLKKLLLRCEFEALRELVRRLPTGIKPLRGREERLQGIIKADIIIIMMKRGKDEVENCKCLFTQFSAGKNFLSLKSVDLNYIPAIDFPPSALSSLSFQTFEHCIIHTTRHQTTCSDTTDTRQQTHRHHSIGSVSYIQPQPDTRPQTTRRDTQIRSYTHILLVHLSPSFLFCPIIIMPVIILPGTMPIIIVPNTMPITMLPIVRLLRDSEKQLHSARIEKEDLSR